MAVDQMSIQAYSLAQNIIQAKQSWMGATTQADRDAAHARAQAARDKLRSMGLGSIADAAGEEDTLAQSSGILSLIQGLFSGSPALPDQPAANPAPTAGGNPNQMLPLVPHSAGGSPAVKKATGSVPESPGAALGPVGSTVTRLVNGAVGALDSGIRGGAQGVGAAAGGLSGTVLAIAGPLVKIGLPIVFLWVIAKSFKVNLGGGRR